MIWGRRVDGEQIEYRGGEVVVEEVMGEKQHAYTHIPRSNTFTGGGRRAHMKSCRLEKNGRQRKEGGVGKKKKNLQYSPLRHVLLELGGCPDRWKVCRSHCHQFHQYILFIFQSNFLQQKHL